MSAGWIEVVCGCMYGGKSEELIRRLRRCGYAKQRTIAFKPAIDDRYDGVRIASHEGLRFDAIPVKTSADILTHLGNAQVVGIDEAQFFDQGLVQVVTTLADTGRRVIVAGLDMDYLGRPFGPMPSLLAIAEQVTKVSAVCMVCGEPATRSQRIAGGAATVQVGAADSYEARCRKHWLPEVAS